MLFEKDTWLNYDMLEQVQIYRPIKYTHMRFWPS